MGAQAVPQSFDTSQGPGGAPSGFHTVSGPYTMAQAEVIPLASIPISTPDPNTMVMDLRQHRPRRMAVEIDPEALRAYYLGNATNPPPPPSMMPGQQPVPPELTGIGAYSRYQTTGQGKPGGSESRAASRSVSGDATESVHTTQGPATQESVIHNQYNYFNYGTIIGSQSGEGHGSVQPSKSGGDDKAQQAQQAGQQQQQKPQGPPQQPQQPPAMPLQQPGQPRPQQQPPQQQPPQQPGGQQQAQQSQQAQQGQQGLHEPMSTPGLTDEIVRDLNNRLNDDNNEVQAGAAMEFFNIIKKNPELASNPDYKPWVDAFLIKIINKNDPVVRQPAVLGLELGLFPDPPVQVMHRLDALMASDAMEGIEKEAIQSIRSKLKAQAATPPPENPLLTLNTTGPHPPHPAGPGQQQAQQQQPPGQQQTQQPKPADKNQGLLETLGLRRPSEQQSQQSPASSPQPPQQPAGAQAPPPGMPPGAMPGLPGGGMPTPEMMAEAMKELQQLSPEELQQLGQAMGMDQMPPEMMAALQDPQTAAMLEQAMAQQPGGAGVPMGMPPQMAGAQGGRLNLVH